MTRLALPVFASSLLLSLACAPQDKNAKVSDGEAKTKPTIEGQLYDGEGFSVVVPKEWMMIDFSRGDFDKMIAEVTKEPAYKGMEPVLKSMAENKQVKFFAIAPEFSKPEFAANLNAIELSAMGMTADKIFEGNKKQLEQMMGGTVPTKMLTVDGSPAVRLDWSAPSPTLKLKTVTVIVVNKDKQVVFTFSLPKDSGDKAEGAIQKVIDSVDMK